MSAAAKKAPLIRDPAAWARDWGWVSRRRAVNIAFELNVLAATIENAMEGDPGATYWAKEARRIAKKLAPAIVPAERKRLRREAGVPS